MTTITVPKIESTPVIVSLISEPKVAISEPQPPKPIERQPVKPKVERVQPKPEKQVAPQPIPKTPISSNSPISPEPVVEAMPISPPTPAPVSMEAPLPLPVVPPRYNAAYLDNPAPSYPALSRRMSEQGKVLLRVYVTMDGRAEKIELKTSSGYSRLDNAALEAVRQWRFVPAKQGEQAVAGWVVVPVDFRLDS